MKQLSSLFLLLGLGTCQSSKIQMKKLEIAPNNIEQYFEIATQYNDQLPKLWNDLKPEERIFAYYMYRASIPGNNILAGQTHRDATQIIDIFEKIIKNKKTIIDNCSKLFDAEQFIKQSEIYLVYLLANHGQYFLKEFENNKRTPENLNLFVLTQNNLILALEALGETDAKNTISKLRDSIFNASVEPTLTVEGSIEKSATNMYGPGFTDADFEKLDPVQKTAINGYFEIEIVNGARVPKVSYYKIGDKFSQELEVAHYWLNKALEHVKKYPAIFDINIQNSLDLMTKFLESGDEQDFKKFCIEWLKTKSKIDYNFGFVEVYEDPKQYRGSFEADVTIKAVDMEKLNNLFPVLEDKLPFPAEFKRQNLHASGAIPNASVNAKLFGSGGAGPVKFTAAYCLPNYDEIRSQYGSKQIMYQMGKGLGELINPELNKKLFNIKDNLEWLNKYDPENKLDHDLSDILTTLHETIGHASGAPAEHIFIDGDQLTISGKTYSVGDKIQVTSDNINEFIGGYMSGLEELRAEIIALYISIFCFDELAENNVFKDWPTKLTKDKITEKLILHMAEAGLYRLVSQADDAKEISQAHARANTTILNYLLDHGGLELVEEKIDVNNLSHTVLGLKITDLKLAMGAVKDLVIRVQKIKSTADGQDVENLMKAYGTCVRHPEYIKILKANRKAVIGDIKEVAEIFPRLIPALDSNNNIADVSAEWPKTFLEQQLELRDLAKSKI